MAIINCIYINVINASNIETNNYNKNTTNVRCYDSSLLVQQAPIQVALLRLDGLNVSDEEAQIIAERLRLRLAEKPVFHVIERNQMEYILSEQGFQISGACDTDSCLVQVGQLLGASWMIAGSISKVGSIYSLQVRLVSVESGRIEGVADADAESLEQLLIRGTSQTSEHLSDLVESGLYSSGGIRTPTPSREGHQGVYFRILIGNTRLVTTAEVEELEAMDIFGPTRVNPFNGSGASSGDLLSADAVARRAPPSSSEYQKGGSYGVILGYSVAPNTIMSMTYSRDNWAHAEFDDEDYFVTEIGLGVVQYLMPDNWYLSAFIVSTAASIEASRITDPVI
ncbi:CsgG/HfaB family protein [Gemmatimonadota bacterium]